MSATPPEGLPDDLVGRIVAGRYRVLSLLGRGAMGSVFLAEHTRMGRRDALKILARKLADDPDALARFTREARNASFISHPNVCEIYDFGETEDGLPFIAMQFVDGETLAEAIEREGGLSAERVVDVGVQITRALEVAHARGIVHRDLKPQNVMLTRSIDGSELVKVVDFGIAKAMTGDDEAQEVTRAGWVVGTPEYVSPEQLGGQQVDGRSDIYSLGIVLFKALTASLPFQGSTWQEVMTARLTEAPRPLSAFRPDLEGNSLLQRALDGALARAPDDRHATVAAFREALVGALEDPREGEAVVTGGRAPAAGVGPEAGVRPEGPGGDADLPPTVAAPVGATAGVGRHRDTPAPRAAGSGGARWLRWIGAAVGVVVLGVGAAVVGAPWGAHDDTEVPPAEGPAVAAGDESVTDGTDGTDATDGGDGAEGGPGGDADPSGESGDGRLAAGQGGTGGSGPPVEGEASPWTPREAEDLLFRQLGAITAEGTGSAGLAAARDTALLVWEEGNMGPAERGLAAYILANALQAMDRRAEALTWAERAVDLVPDNRGYLALLDGLRRGGA